MRQFIMCLIARDFLKPKFKVQLEAALKVEPDQFHRAKINQGFKPTVVQSKLLLLSYLKC